MVSLADFFIRFPISAIPLSLSEEEAASSDRGGDSDALGRASGLNVGISCTRF